METDNDMDEFENNNSNGNYGHVTESQSIPAFATVQTYPCSNCGRRFNTESLRKHQPICKKTSQKQPRKIFDTGKQRATDSDVPYKATKETTEFYKDGVKPKSDKPKTKNNNWREGHNALVRTIRQAREVTRAIETGAPLPKQMPAQVPSDYIQCEYCHRHFNKFSAERHIPFCETQFKRKQMHHQITHNIRTPPGHNNQHGRVNQQEHQINSVLSKLVPKRSQKTNGEKDYSKPTFNPNEYKVNHPTDDTSPKYGNQRTPKTRSATGNYLPGKMRTGRTAESDGLNTLAGVGRGQQKNDPSSQLQPRITRLKTRSPSPAQINGDHQQQQPKVKMPTAAKHCHECGEGFPVEWAKYCCECGEKRFGID